MKVGLYFGSFNPVHNGHLIIANHLLQNTDLDQVWFVISPQNPFKPSSTLLNEYHRLHLVQIAIESVPQMQACDIEFRLPKPSYTADTLAYLIDKYPQHKFTILMGSDSYQNLPRWKNSEYIINNYQVYIYIRPGFPVEHLYKANHQIVHAPHLDISATFIRESIQKNHSIQFLVPDAVWNEIETNRYYKK